MVNRMSGEVGAGVAGWKMLSGMMAGGGIAAGLAFLVLICIRRPRTDKEWVVALVSTVMSSFGGGAFLILRYDLVVWLLTADPVRLTLGALSLIGVVFACGLPGWAVVRWVFNYIAKRESADFLDVVAEAKERVL